MHIPDHPQMIRFGEKECCALRAALKNHFEKIFDFLSGAIPEKRLLLYRDIIVEPKQCGGANTLGFIPNEEHKNFYSMAAQLEFERLAKTTPWLPNHKLSCGCEAMEHANALKKILKLLNAEENSVN